jgi:hypothetical protein
MSFGFYPASAAGKGLLKLRGSMQQLVTPRVSRQEKVPAEDIDFLNAGKTIEPAARPRSTLCACQTILNPLHYI